MTNETENVVQHLVGEALSNDANIAKIAMIVIHPETRQEIKAEIIVSIVE